MSNTTNEHAAKCEKWRRIGAESQKPADPSTGRMPMIYDWDCYTYEPSTVELPTRVPRDPIEMRDIYEAKITSGELRVVRKESVPHVFDADRWASMPCGYRFHRSDEWNFWNFCPGCGASIV